MSTGAVIVAAVVIVALLICAELVARWKLRSRLVELSTGMIGTRPAISLARRPVLLQLAERKLAGVGIDTLDGAPEPSTIIVHGHARGIEQVAGGLRLGALTASATLPLAWMRRAAESAQAGSDGVVVRSISLMPRRGALSVTVRLPVAFGRGVDIRLAIAVTVDDGRLVFRATDLSMPVNPVPIPIPIAWAIDSWIVQLRSSVIPPALDALTISAIRWESDAVVLDVTARDATVPID